MVIPAGGLPKWTRASPTVRAYRFDCSGAQRAPWAAAGFAALCRPHTPCRGAACRSRRCTPDSYWLPLKWYTPIASVAAPQRISAKVVGSADGKTVLHLSARPLIPTECLIILFNALSVFFIIFTLMRKCAPYFLPAILAFTILLTGSTLWQAKACLNRFAEKICRRFCSE